MKRPLRFHELNEEAKKEAGSRVHEKECSRMDWSIESKYISEDINETIYHYKLDGQDIPWEDRYGISMDLSSISTNNEFYETFLSEEQMALMGDLENLSYYGLEHIVFDGYENTDFVLRGEYDSDLDINVALAFLDEYGEQDDKDEIAFIRLLADDDWTDEQEEKLQSVVAPLAERLTEELSNVIDAKMQEIREELYSMVRNSVDYYESDKYYYDELEAETYFEEKYRFNEKGEIVEVDGDIVHEYEQEYKEYVDKNISAA